jgi:hypothetical protein
MPGGRVPRICGKDEVKNPSDLLIQVLSGVYLYHLLLQALAAH